MLTAMAARNALTIGVVKDGLAEIAEVQRHEASETEWMDINI